MVHTTLSVTTVGTCRLVDPLAAIARDPSRGILCNTTNVYGFTHTAREALQQIAYLDGHGLPQEFECFLSATGKFAPLLPRARPDVWVVEISSMKEVLLDGVYLQINYIERVFRDRPSLLRTFWRKRREEDRPERERLLRSDPAFDGCGAVAKRMLLDAHTTQTTLDSLEADMLALRARVPEPVVFVTHINARNSAGKLLRGRVELSGWMHTIAARHKLSLFDPTPHVNAAGVARALENGGSDLNHYAPAFLGVIGRKLDLLFLRPLVRAKAAAEGAKPGGDRPESEDLERAHMEREDQRTVVPPGAEPGGASDSAIRALIGRGELATARAALERRLADVPGDAEAHLLFGRLALESKRPSEAVPPLERARSLAPDNAEAAILLVRALLRLDRHGDGAELAAELVRRWPDSARALSTAAQAFRKAKRHQEAAQALRALAGLRPADARVRADLGEALLKTRDYEAADGAAREALELGPGEEARAHAVRAAALRRLKRPAALAAFGAEAAAQAPALAREIAEDLVGQGCPEDAALVAAALPDSERSEALGEPLARCLERRAKDAAARRDGAAAAAAWKALLRIEPENPAGVAARRKLVQAHVAEGRAAAKDNDFARALAALKRALELSPENAALLREAAIAAERAEEWAFSCVTWQRLVDLGADDHTAAARLGRAAVRAGDFGRALASWQRVLTLAPDQAEAARMMHWTLRQAAAAMHEDAEAERLEAALTKARLVLAHDAGNRHARLALQRIGEAAVRRMEAADDEPAAEAAARLALEANPQADAALKVLARIFERGRRYAEALPVYESLAALRATDAALWVKVAKLHRILRNAGASAVAARRALQIEPSNPVALRLLDSEDAPLRAAA